MNIAAKTQELGQKPKKRCWILVICAFVIGVIGGILIGIYRPNEITFIIRTNGEVNLHPLPRDVVRWLVEDPEEPDDPKNPVYGQVTFYSKDQKGVPCELTPDPSTAATYTIRTCRVTTVPLDYYYTCQNHGRPCKDPGKGPGSVPGPHSTMYQQTVGFVWDEVLHNLEFAWDDFRDFRYDKIAEVSTEHKDVKSLPANVNTAALQPPPNGSIFCGSDNKPKVSDIAYKANSGDAIEWSSSLANPPSGNPTYSFTLQPPLGCREKQPPSFSSQQPHAICTLTGWTVDQSYNYPVTVNDTKCPGTTNGKITIYQPINPQISCNGGAASVTPIQYTAGSIDPIQWNASVSNYSFDLGSATPSPLTCAEGVSAFSDANPYATCTLTSAAKGNYTYTVSVPGCSAATGQITVQ
ncbi:hypothetical protein H7849_19040 [Alloacidobacterium dinghuense]|uniref:Uncharacterized protein n=1 Tax=Alloacidobacterium dinghuense TaxID=2763107 RepID=A0A7G8BF53_9BACT|nr:hypothetical protein [Alloacidobacterium dinghuense]QNI31173.1 hypothetical protein H7849_19040 [Alloacidobacterium dinghuense]